MKTLMRAIVCTAWVATAIFLAPIWVPVVILASTGVLAKELKGDPEDV